MVSPSNVSLLVRAAVKSINGTQRHQWKKGIPISYERRTHGILVAVYAHTASYRFFFNGGANPWNTSCAGCSDTVLHDLTAWIHRVPELS
jgi:hypothetical protein